MDFQTSVKTCLTEKYADFSGRASRSEYWWFVLAYVIGAVVVSLLQVRLLYILYMLALIVPAAAAGWRRLQDTGKPGWYILIPMGVSLISTLFMPRMPHAGFGGGPMMGGAPNMGAFAFAGLLGLVQLVLAVIFIWWLTRPSDPQSNEYGPVPQA